MVRRLYLMPYVPQSRKGEEAPKYLTEMPSWSCVTLGEHCVASVTGDLLVHTTLGGHPDVVQSSSNIDDALGWLSGPVNAAFRVVGYPGDNTHTTLWREAFRKLCTSGQFLHRTGEIFPLKGIGRGVKFKDLPEAVKVKLRRAASSQGFSLKGLDNTDLRTLLRLAGENYSGRILLSGEVL